MGKRLPLILAAISLTAAAPPKKPASDLKGARVVHLSDKDVATIYVHPGGSVISFAAKPAKVMVGREKQFDVQVIDHDVAIVALSEAASTNMFVYLLGRRYSFNLVASSSRGERIILVRDPGDDRVEVDIK